MNKQGLLLCAKYSVAPNYFGYCGPRENKSLIDHLKEEIADREIQSILSEFETLHLYLTLIAKENKINDTFDERVVEAYWLGNELLRNISSKDYSYLLDEKLHLGKKWKSESLNKLVYQINTAIVYPHHSFHVFNIFKRTGHDPSFHTITTMDECRIGWGKIKRIQDPSELKIKNRARYVYVEMKPLLLVNNTLCFGKKILKKINLTYCQTNFFSNLKENEWISFHWSYVCDKVTCTQVKNLEYYTQKAIDFYNK